MGRGRRQAGRGFGGGGGGGEDQYGETFVSQDRADRSGSTARGGGAGGSAGGGGFTGGGEAGGARRDSNVSFQRHVPKFLQAHMHHLGKGHGVGLGGDEEPALDGAPPPAKRLRRGDDEEEDDEINAADEQEALQRAVAEDPGLVAQHPELAGVAGLALAADEKEKGNRAFAEKRHDDAARHFSVAIKLDPGNAVYLSNRAAALTALGRWDAALSDATACARLKPGWAKAWGRVAAALLGRGDAAEARDAYDRALALEPEDRGLQEARHRADVATRKAAEERRHRFRQTRGGSKGGHRGRGDAGLPAQRNGRLLSFDDEKSGEEN